VRKHDGFCHAQVPIFFAVADCGCCVGGGGVFGVLREREPVYEGRKLSEWAKMYAEGLDLTNGAHQVRQAADAIREIGTNGIPYLARWIQYIRPAWQTAVKERINSVVENINPSLQITFGSKRLYLGGYAFLALIALDNETGGTNKEINHTLLGQEEPRFVSPANFPMFMRVLTNGNIATPSKVTLGFVIGLLETNATSAVPTLEGLLTDPELEVRRVATNALRRIRNDTNLTSFHK